jgi:uncharacterized protein with beta-barrel porin domain
LIVDGDIRSSSGVTVTAGGTLAGSGHVSSTTVNDGGTLAPGHNDNPQMLVDGNLTFTANATYLVQVSPTSATNAAVTGTATLGGATVARTSRRAPPSRSRTTFSPRQAGSTAPLSIRRSRPTCRRSSPPP